ncbi:MAG TPA: ATP-binding cassette domain-containing protein [Mycobacteriales bacterium]|nr:ATP-binding cassette domain-containing protein [Mycobacteriales bacterium]
MTQASTAVQVAGLRKAFRVAEREAGLRASVRSLVRRQYRDVLAVAGISFTVAAGEVVGFLGPNGAGKTTTLKMLSGLLFPTGGEVLVLGHLPSRREHAYLRRITLVMGNRNQLQWDIPALDSFEMSRAIYRIPSAEFRRIRDELVELLEIGDQVRKPVRTLSLGERMKAEVAGALLHRPEVLFLDEPTIGLDVTMQKRLRAFLAEYNRRYAATILLTSHYMADVEALCKRVVVIDAGAIRYDGGLRELSTRYTRQQTLTVAVGESAPDLSGYGEVLSTDGGRVSIRVAKAETSQVAARLLRDHAITDLTITDPPVEDVIEHLFAAGTPAP